MTCLPVRGDDRGRQGASIELLFVYVDAASSAGMRRVCRGQDGKAVLSCEPGHVCSFLRRLKRPK